MACDPDTLLSAIACLEQKVQGTMLDAVEIRLLCAILDNETMSCDPQTLITEASCLFACIPPGAAMAVKLSLLCQIADGGGGGGGGAVQVYEDRAPTAPDDVSKAALSYDSSTGVLSQWNIGGAVWV